MREVFGIGKPRVLQGLRAALLRLVRALLAAIASASAGFGRWSLIRPANRSIYSKCALAVC
jgi:hypothetical protein